jgi:hypothetical protein
MRLVCFIDDEDGQVATCLKEIEDEPVICCETCEYNPFPGKKIPEDRVLYRGDSKP